MSLTMMSKLLISLEFLPPNRGVYPPNIGGGGGGVMPRCLLLGALALLSLMLPATADAQEQAHVHHYLGPGGRLYSGDL